MKMKNIAYFFGSFNPIHNAHFKLGETVIKNLDLIDEVHFVISPNNPFKLNDKKISEKDRYEMLKLSLNDFKNLKANDIELNTNSPNYTYDTIKKLEKMSNVYLILGSDIINEIHKWKEYEKVVKYPIILFKRPEHNLSKKIDNFNIIKVFESTSNISSTMVRNLLIEGKYDCIKKLIPIEAYEYMMENKEKIKHSIT